MLTKRRQTIDDDDDDECKEVIHKICSYDELFFNWNIYVYLSQLN